MTYNQGLLIGRFQPFHQGHYHAIEYALEQVNHLLLGIGSSNRSMEVKNPFTIQERILMIDSSLTPQQKEKISIHPIPDLQNHKKWVDLIEQTLPSFDVVFTNDDITGRLYTKKGIPVRDIPFLNRVHLSGTVIRHLISSKKEWQHLVPTGTVSVVKPIQDRLHKNTTESVRNPDDT